MPNKKTYTEEQVKKIISSVGATGVSTFCPTRSQFTQVIQLSIRLKNWQYKYLAQILDPHPSIFKPPPKRIDFVTQISVKLMHNIFEKILGDKNLLMHKTPDDSSRKIFTVQTTFKVKTEQGPKTLSISKVNKLIS